MEQAPGAVGSSSTASSKTWNSSMLFLWQLCETFNKPVFKKPILLQFLQEHQ